MKEINAVSVKSAEGLRIGYIGGGSMNWAWDLMGDLALEPQLSGVVRLYDLNHNAAKANETIGNKLNNYPAAKGKWVYEAKTTLKETLEDVDFVVISILPGTFEEMESDVHAPEKYGIFQSVGDTVGPAGIIRAMRTIPMYVEIAEAIKTYCPSAWVINYTNPMSVCTGTLYRVFPEIKAFGCCHEVFHIQKVLAKMLASECGLDNVLWKDIRLNVFGVNHFTWVNQASYGEMDLMPVFKKFAEKNAETGFPLNTRDSDPQNAFRNSNKVCFDLFRKFHIIPAAGDRHIAEFMPPWYLKDPETVSRWGFGLTEVSYRKKTRAERLEKSSNILSGKEDFEIKPSGEDGTEQIKAILGLSEIVTSVNLPNHGQVTGLPTGAIVETNALFGKDFVRPVFAGSIPPAINAIALKHAENQKLMVEAGIKKDMSLAFAAFLNDNLMTLNIWDAEKLFKEMTENTKAYLHGWGEF